MRSIAFDRTQGHEVPGVYPHHSFYPTLPTLLYPNTTLLSLLLLYLALLILFFVIDR